MSHTGDDMVSSEDVSCGMKEESILRKERRRVTFGLIEGMRALYVNRPDD